MTQHTPAPWSVSSNRLYYVLAPDKRAIVRILSTSSRSAVEQMANVRLIAAAPETAAERDRLKAINAELVAALERLIAVEGGAWNIERYAREKAEANQTARDALAKARGEK